MTPEVTVHADIALRAIINGLRTAKRFDGDTWMYRRGQIDVIQVFLAPTHELLEEANALLDDYKKKSDEADAQRFVKLASQVRTANR